MTDSLARCGEADGAHIDIHVPVEVVYWTSTLGVSKDRLLEAVEAVGDDVDRVRDHLIHR